MKTLKIVHRAQQVMYCSIEFFFIYCDGKKSKEDHTGTQKIEKMKKEILKMGKLFISVPLINVYFVLLQDFCLIFHVNYGFYYYFSFFSFFSFSVFHSFFFGKNFYVIKKSFWLQRNERILIHFIFFRCSV